MVLENVTNVPVDFVLQMGQVVLWLQTLGIITLILFVSTLINLIVIFKRRKRELIIRRRLESIENKLDKLLKKK